MPCFPEVPNRHAILSAIHQAKLYGILDTGYSDPAQWAAMATEIISGGGGILQIRAKGVDESSIRRWTPAVLEVCNQAGIPLILNDHPQLARELNVHGCHVGQDDLALDEVRKILLPWQICGKSTHSLAQAVAAEKEGADYIGFGPIFSTPTKPDYIPIGEHEIRVMHDRVAIPAFCIGGIKKENIAELIHSGTQRAVIVSGLLLAESISEYASTVVRCFETCAKTN